MASSRTSADHHDRWTTAILAHYLLATKTDDLWNHNEFKAALRGFNAIVPDPNTLHFADVSLNVH